MSALISGDRVHLRRLTVDDVTETYCRWMNDPQVNQYLESRYVEHTIPSIREFVASVSASADHVFAAIVLNHSSSGARHIGNIKLGPVNRHHHYADIGLLIGEPDCWGKGYASDAIGLITRHAFEALKLHKVTAGAYSLNQGSAKAFLKNGFSQEGLRRQHYLCGGQFVDEILLGKVNPAWAPQGARV